ncbi:RrF2 family transcriptional regulator [Myroides injenensis]|uniref:RrF2 family transcriptional regulator n=1 Tax=Myroides injenensis TaxID=1183151 RepID=UPI000289CEED|nr:Rrf2 family transcriptional regulator [Myroides injenensis]
MGVFSKTCQYAIRAVFYIAKRSEQGYKSNIKEIASEVNSPEHFLAKILQKLSKEGLIQSIKGPNGGFYIDIPHLDRPLIDIVIAIEGKELLTECGMGLSYCSEKNPCPLHKDFKIIRTKLIKLLKSTTIGQFNEELLQGQLTLNK